MNAGPAPARGGWAALAVLLLGAFLPILDFNVVNLAIPSIRADLQASPSQLQLVMNGYMSTYAVLLITGGRLGDRFGRRRMFMLGLAGFTIASALCGTAQTADWLIGGRLLQAATATVMAPQVIASIRDIFPGHRLRMALALYGATFGLAFVTGQVVGGIIVEARPFGLAWQPVFLVNVPLGLLALLGAWLLLRDSRSPNPQRMDLVGVAISSTALVSLVLPLTAGREFGWPWWCFAMLAATPLLVFAFVRWEKRTASRGADPLVRVDLFRRPAMALGAPIAAAFYTTSAMFMTIAILLQDGEHVAAAKSGAALLPMSASYFAVSLSSAALSTRVGRWLTALGMAAQVAGLLAIGAAAAMGTAGISPIGLVMLGAGFGIIMPTIVGTVVGGVQPEHAGLAAGIVMSALQVGASTGVAIIGSVFFAALGHPHGVESYRHAFAMAAFANAALSAFGMALAVWLAVSRVRGRPKDMTMAIRPAVAGDAEAVTVLTRAAYSKWVSFIGREPLPMAMDHAAMIRDHRVDLLLLEDELVALVEIVECHDCLLIENVAVDPRFQKKGYGRLLIGHAERLAAGTNHGRVRLYTNGRFAQNVNLYLSLGYNIERLEKLDGGVAVHMSKVVASTLSDAELPAHRSEGQSPASDR